MKGQEFRRHFRLELEDDNIEVTLKSEEKKLKGIIRDISNGGIAFKLKNEKDVRVDILNDEFEASFFMYDRLFKFEMKILRYFRENGEIYYSGEFSGDSKIKKSQLSLLLMKRKLIEGE